MQRDGERGCRGASIESCIGRPSCDGVHREINSTDDIAGLDENDTSGINILGSRKERGVIDATRRDVVPALRNILQSKMSSRIGLRNAG